MAVTGYADGNFKGDYSYYFVTMSVGNIPSL